MTAAVAALPMYDWPEVAPATDRLWAALRDALRAEGVPAPDALTRDRTPEAIWRDPGLVLAMTCGLPFVRGLGDDVALVGALDYGVPGAPVGWYRSAVVVRADDARETLAGFRGARLALNGRDSQSGWGAMLHHVAPMADRGRFFGSAEVTGAHAASVARVAEGVADIAAVDWVSWRMALAFRPEAARLRVLMLTEPTPALPLIAAAGADLPRYRAAIGAALAGLAPEAKAALGLGDFVPLAPGGYAVIAERAQAARRRLARDPAL